LIKLPL